MLKCFGLGCLALLLMAGGCSAPSAPAASVSGDPADAERTQAVHAESLLKKRIQQQLKKKEWEFTLRLEDNIRFSGHQSGEDWSLKSKGNESIRIVKKGEKITVTKGNKQETMDQRQFGLLSPADHLKLVAQSTLRARILPNRVIGGVTSSGIQADLNSEPVGDKLGEWMGSQFEGKGVATRASRKFRVRYRLWFEERNPELVQLQVQIIPLAGVGKEETLQYLFH